MGPRATWGPVSNLRVHACNLHCAKGVYAWAHLSFISHEVRAKQKLQERVCCFESRLHWANPRTGDPAYTLVASCVRDVAGNKRASGTINDTRGWASWTRNLKGVDTQLLSFFRILRHTAYRLFMWWVWGFPGQRNCQKLPACVHRRIWEAFLLSQSYVMFAWT